MYQSEDALNSAYLDVYYNGYYYDSIRVGEAAYLYGPGGSWSDVCTVKNTSSAYFYMSTDSKPTTSSNVDTIEFGPKSLDTCEEILIYTAQRYTISYNKNNATSGSTPSSQYKMHGSSITLGTNSMSRTGYSANGWNTNSSGTGTHYNNGATYSGNGNATLYAE